MKKETRRIGALNTFARPASIRAKKWEAFNSDASAIVETICAALGIEKSQLARRSVGVIGAGGTGRAAVAALGALGCAISIFNRSLERAEVLSQTFSSKRNAFGAHPLESLAGSSLDVYINTTSLGMVPDIDVSPFDFGMPNLTTSSLVFDCVYTPFETKLLRQATDAGAKSVSGMEMFLRQAQRQFEAWTGRPAPLDAMRRVAMERLMK